MKTYNRESVLLRCLSVLVSIAIITGVLSLIQVSAGAEAEPDIWDGTVATGFESGTGTEDDPYIIKTPEQLAYLAQLVNAGVTAYSVKLANDIYLNNTDNWENWGTTAPANKWTPIGRPLTEIKAEEYEHEPEDYRYGFMGIFDGNGCAVYGIYTDNTQDYQGLFGYILEGTVKNLTIEKSYVCGNRFVGGITGVGYAALIINCCNNGIVAGKDSYIGGISGYTYFMNIQSASSIEYFMDVMMGKRHGTDINYCSNTGRVTGSSSVGGICGLLYNHCNLTKCFNAGDVSGISDVGGICGVNVYLASIVNCYNTGNVIGSGSCIGGISGELGYETNIEQCYNTGKVTGDCYTGGICGYYYQGVFCGYFWNCYYLNACASDRNGTIQYGYGNEQVGSSAVDISGCTTGLSESQLTEAGSFAGFDFEEDWKIPAAGSAYKYPVFQEEIAPETGDSATVFVIVALVSLFGMGIVIRSRRDY